MQLDNAWLSRQRNFIFISDDTVFALWNKSACALQEGIPIGCEYISPWEAHQPAVNFPWYEILVAYFFPEEICLAHYYRMLPCILLSA